MRADLFAFLVSALCATARPVSAQVQPNQIPFGVVHTGATVEASFLVKERGDDKSIKFEITASKFIKVLKKTVEARQFGAGKDYVMGSVEIAIDTSTAGAFNGEVAITFGTQTAKLPVRATVKPHQESLLRLLVVETPFERYSTSDGRHFEPWAELVKSASWNVNYVLSPRRGLVIPDRDLSWFDTILLGPHALFWLTPTDVKRVRAFVEGGGRVIVAANHFYMGTVEKANLVLQGYGLEMQERESAMKTVSLDKNDLDPELVRLGVAAAHFFRASPVALTGKERGRVLARSLGLGLPEFGFIAMSPAGKGEVVALGESLWCFWLTKERDLTGDNAKLLRWLIESGQQRRRRLAAQGQPLSPAEVNRCWLALKSTDPDAVADAIGSLAFTPAAGQQTIPFLRKNVKPALPPDMKQVGPLIDALNSDEFAAREKAQKELKALGEEAVPALRKALESNPPAETSRRLESLLHQPPTLRPETMQTLRAVEVLENIATPEARQFLEELAKGDRQAFLTKRAQAALERLAETKAR